MEKKREVTQEELQQLIQSQSGEFIIHVELSEEQEGEDGTIST